MLKVKNVQNNQVLLSALFKLDNTSVSKQKSKLSGLKHRINGFVLNFDVIELPFI